MWWWKVIPPAVLLGKIIYDAVSEEKADKKRESPHVTIAELDQQIVFEERGHLEGRKILVVGRTGAGKSSLINMLYGSPVLSVGHIASTTRWVEGVRVELHDTNAVLVDTPGYGEVMTSNEYVDGLLNWAQKHKGDIVAVMLVVQADSKAHAEDKKILTRLLLEHPSLPVILVLSQVDKILPVREKLVDDEWPPRDNPDQPKAKHIEAKIREVCRQFGIPPDSIAPSSADADSYNRRGLLDLMAGCVD